MIKALNSPNWAFAVADRLAAVKGPLLCVQYAVRLSGSMPHYGKRNAWHVLSKALLDAPAGGHPCRLILPSANHAVMGAGATRESISWLREAGWSIRFAPVACPTHAKVILQSWTWASVGSHNWTEASCVRTWEQSIQTDSQALVSELWQAADALWTKASS